ncbi:MAG: LptF/LptG family permease [Gemmatimonadota bacterium]
MRILSVYILRRLAAPFAFALTALTALMLLDQLAKLFGKLVGKGLGWRVVAEVFALSIPFMLAVIVPMAVLVAVLYSFTQMAGDNEITAMKASGVSLLRITLPVVGASLVVALGLFWFNDNVLPDANHQLQTLRRSIGRKSPTFALSPRTVNEVVSRELFLEAQRIDPETNHLRDVTIWDASRPAHVRTIIADSGTMAFNATHTDLYLTLYDGEIRETEVERQDEFQRIWFEVQFLRVPDIGNELERQSTGSRGDRELPIDSMRVQADSNYARADEAARTSAALAVAYTAQLLGGLADFEELEAGALAPDSTAEVGVLAAWRSGRRLATPAAAENSFRSHAAQQDRFTKAALRFEVEIWKKYSIPAACVVFVLIGIPIAVRYHRGGISMVVGVSFVVFTAYYVALIGGESVADQELLSPFWAMWSPNILFLALGIAAFFHSRRAGG